MASGRENTGLGGDRRGVAAVEFALVVPVFLIILLGTFDVVQLMRTQLRLDAVASELGEIVSRCNQITSPGDTAQFWAYAQRIAGSLVDVTGTTGGAVVVSALYNSSGRTRVAWQARAGNTGYASTIASAAILANISVPAGQTLMATEVFATVQPWVLSASFMGPVVPDRLYAVAMFLARSPNPAQLQQAPATSSAMACTA